MSFNFSVPRTSFDGHSIWLSTPELTDLRSAAIPNLSGDPSRVNEEVDRHRAVTLEQVNDFVRTRLTKDNRASLLYVPKPDEDDGATGEKLMQQRGEKRLGGGTDAGASQCSAMLHAPREGLHSGRSGDVSEQTACR